MQLHFGVPSFRAQERIADRLAGRIRWMLFITTRLEAMRHLWFEEAVCLSAGCAHQGVIDSNGKPHHPRWPGSHAREVLQRLALFEGRFGRKRNQHTSKGKRGTN